MTKLRRYHFEQRAHWSAGLLARAALDPGASGFALAVPWGAGTQLLAQAGRAAAIGPEGIACWNDGAQRLWQAEPDAAEPASSIVPVALAGAAHLALGRTQCWAADARPQLSAYLRDAPMQRLRVALDVERIIDLAADGHDGVWVLAARGAQAMALHVDCSGDIGTCVELASNCGLPRALACVGARLVVLDASGTLLRWIDPQRPAAAALEVALRAARPGGCASVIGSFSGGMQEGMARVAVGGVDLPAFGGGAWVVACNGDGEWLGGAIELAEAPLDLACGADALLVTSAHAVWRWRLDASGTARRSEGSAAFITPALGSPPAAGRAPWLRVEVQALLPPGTSLEISFAGSDDAQQLAEVRALFGQADLAPALRRQRVTELLGWSAPLRFERIEGSAADAITPCVLPLHEQRTRWLWIAIELIAAPGAAAPRVISLDVLYPNESLMQQLPAIYRRQGEQPGDFLRTLVAALDTSVHGLDERIATLGRLVDPQDAPEPWLDAIARWLGLPWDDTLALPTKRALLAAAPTLLEQRGTRAGLQVLLAALLPSRRARIEDIGVDHGFARLGGARLPALLAGWPFEAAVLNAKACIGHARLADATRPIDTVAWLAGQVVIEIAATPAERRSWLPWLRPLLDAMTPLTARLRLHWIAPGASRTTPLLGDTLTLDGDPPPLLGEGATLGRSRLDARRAATLDGAGAAPDMRLY